MQSTVSSVAVTVALIVVNILPLSYLVQYSVVQHDMYVCEGHRTIMPVGRTPSMTAAAGSNILYL